MLNTPADCIRVNDTVDFCCLEVAKLLKCVNKLLVRCLFRLSRDTSLICFYIIWDPFLYFKHFLWLYSSSQAFLYTGLEDVQMLKENYPF